ncbi:MAG TPA: hypothetical protein VGO67_04520 [Verrucomicrobiae bacterium]
MALLGAIVTGWGQWELTSELRWNPLDGKPLPKQGASATYDFRSSSGRFWIEVALPMESRYGGAADVRLRCPLEFQIFTEATSLTTFTSPNLQEVGEYGYSHEDVFRAGTISLPKPGQYRLVVKNLENDARIPKGKISLIRDENTEDAAVVSGVLWLLKWLFLIMAISSGGRLVFAWWNQKRQTGQ